MVLSGVILNNLVIPLFAVTAIWLINRGQYVELFTGFFITLVLSDSFLHYFAFAATLKAVYIIILLLPLFFERRNINLDLSISYHKNFILFFLFATFCILFSPAVSVAVQKTLSYLLLLVVVPIYFVGLYRLYGNAFLKLYVYAGALVLVACYIMYIVNPSYAIYFHTGRARGIFGNPNGLGMYSFVYFVSFYTINYHFPRLLTKRERLAFFLLPVSCLIWSGSRGQTLSALFFLLSQYTFRKSFYLGLFISLAAVFSISFIEIDIPAILSSLGLGDFARVDTIEKGSGRTIARDFAWQHIQQSFWVGKGFSYTEYLFHLPESEALFMKLGHIGNSHNAFLTVWLDTGLIGLVLFLLGWASIFFKASRKSELTLPIVFAVVASNMVESWLIGSLNPFTIQLIILLTILIFIKRDNGRITAKDDDLPSLAKIK
ncbi:O-antigen ligase family protein [Pontibacter harenae]|uniref:O-antigen ligase family protein n=1 Tax=Pontibacter harenae TaxID=2894083 RepID=UPI001E426A05|nr:O-antigen ligase family protein [Pontibacter harenae]MCC9168224.1 O-antigen ligase family protein [Pontibacter harenae]